MTSLKYVKGPLDSEATGTVYPLSPGQVAPLSIRKREWETGEWRGKYVLVVPSKKSLTQFSPYLRWVGAK